MPNTGNMTISYRRGTLAVGPTRAAERDRASMPTLIKLLAESALHRAIFDACTVPIVLVDMRAPEHPLVLANPAFETAFGISSSASKGHPMANVLFAGSRDAVRHLLGSAASRVPVVATRVDGVQVACEATAGMVRSPQGEIQYAVVALSRQTAGLNGKLESAVAALTCATV